MTGTGDLASLLNSTLLELNLISELNLTIGNIMRFYEAVPMEPAIDLRFAPCINIPVLCLEMIMPSRVNAPSPTIVLASTNHKTLVIHSVHSFSFGDIVKTGHVAAISFPIREETYQVATLLTVTPLLYRCVHEIVQHGLGPVLDTVRYLVHKYHPDIAQDMTDAASHIWNIVTTGTRLSTMERIQVLNSLARYLNLLKKIENVLNRLA